MDKSRTVFESVNIDNVASLRRLMRGLHYTMTHTVLNPGADELQEMRSEESQAVTSMLVAMRLGVPRYTLLLRGCLRFVQTISQSDVQVLAAAQELANIGNPIYFKSPGAFRQEYEKAERAFFQVVGADQFIAENILEEKAPGVYGIQEYNTRKASLIEKSLRAKEVTESPPTFQQGHFSVLSRDVENAPSSAAGNQPADHVIIAADNQSYHFPAAPVTTTKSRKRTAEITTKHQDQQAPNVKTRRTNLLTATKRDQDLSSIIEKRKTSRMNGDLIADPKPATTTGCRVAFAISQPPRTTKSRRTTVAEKEGEFMGDSEMTDAPNTGTDLYPAAGVVPDIVPVKFQRSVVSTVRRKSILEKGTDSILDSYKNDGAAFTQLQYPRVAKPQDSILGSHQNDGAALTQPQRRRVTKNRARTVLDKDTDSMFDSHKKDGAAITRPQHCRVTKSRAKLVLDKDKDSMFDSHKKDGAAALTQPQHRRVAKRRAGTVLNKETDSIDGSSLAKGIMGVNAKIIPPSTLVITYGTASAKSRRSSVIDNGTTTVPGRMKYTVLDTSVANTTSAKIDKLSSRVMTPLVSAIEDRRQSGAIAKKSSDNGANIPCPTATLVPTNTKLQQQLMAKSQPVLPALSATSREGVQNTRVRRGTVKKMNEKAGLSGSGSSTTSGTRSFLKPRYKSPYEPEDKPGTFDTYCRSCKSYLEESAFRRDAKTGLPERSCISCNEKPGQKASNTLGLQTEVQLDRWMAQNTSGSSRR